MRVLLGFDGGGTKTECAVLDETGRVLTSAKAGPSNPTRIGFENACQELAAAADLALHQLGATRTDVAALCAGLAGTAKPENHDRMRALLSAAFPGTLVHVLTDLELALAAVPDGPAIVLVAGTGSAAIGRDAHGQLQRAGGYGRDVSDEGSAYDVGRLAIEHALAARASSGADSPLGKQVLRQLGCNSWDEVQRKVSADRDAVYPRVFPVVAAAADAGDASARALLTAAAAKLSALVTALAASLHGSSPFALAKTGGMIGRSIFLDDALGSALAHSVPQATAISSPTRLAEVAARIAMRLPTSPKGAS